ncbi:MAG: exosome complex RNA-binding protein Csl4 [Archaeoglobaceae archaeon]|nr:exosome complex RNA-binding protein Csl4 [Archaeoglobaceae archaeon]MDW7989172.1 exosome complex RNA-binding protein Csl4 [Archaeoglobaceae archaeon]
MRKRVVFPGDRIGTIEEFKAGKGVYEENRELFAFVAGFLELKNKVVNVSSFRTIPEIKKDDIVIGRIVDIRGNFAMVEIVRKKGESRDLSYTNHGFLHVSNVGERVENIGNAINYLDIIKARVLDPSPRLSIKEPEMGVLKAFCSSCRNELFLDSGRLKCRSCGKEEIRKVSDSYGKGEW